MNPVKSLIRWLFWIGLFSILLLVVYRRESGLPSVEHDGGGMFSPRFDEVVSLTWQRGAETVAAANSGGRWRLLKPVACEADGAIIERLLSELEHTRATDVIMPQEAEQRRVSRETFGLEPPAASITLEYADGTSESVLLGRLTADETEIYVGRAGTSRIELMPRAFWDALPKTAVDARSRTFLGAAAERATAVEIRRPESGSVQLALESGTWILRQPVGRVADPRTVQALLARLYEFRADSFAQSAMPEISAQTTNTAAEVLLASTPRLNQYGLDDEHAIRIWVSERGREQPLRLRLGRLSASQPGQVYALFENDDVLVTVTNAYWTALESSLQEVFAGARFYNGDPDEIQQLHLVVGDQTVDVVRNAGGGWMLAGVDGRRADSEYINTWLTSIVRLRPELNLPAVVLPLGQPIAKVTLTGKQTPFELEVFALEDSARDYCLRLPGAASNVCVVAATNLPPELRGNLDVRRFADRTVLSVPSAAVKAVAVTRYEPNGVTNSVSCTLPSPNGVWQTESGVLDVPAFKEWLGQFVDLRAQYVEQLNPPPQALTLYGLSSPMLEVRFDLTGDDALRRVLLIGAKARGGGRYAMLRGRELVYVLSDETLAAIDRTFIQPRTEP